MHRVNLITKVAARSLVIRNFKLTPVFIKPLSNLSTKYFHSFVVNYNEKQNDKQEAPKQEETKQDKQEQKIEDQLQQALTQLKQLQADHKSLYSKYLEALADAENTRRIANNDVEKAKKFALQSFAKNLLILPDTFQMALQHIPKEIPENMKSFVEGVKMMTGVIEQVFEKHGIVKMENPMDKPFDPRYHEAICRIQDPNTKDGTVKHVFKEGWFLNERVIRAAQVGVVTNDEAPQEENKQEEEKKEEEKKEEEKKE